MYVNCGKYITRQICVYEGVDLCVYDLLIRIKLSTPKAPTVAYTFRYLS